jgi:hypothetical protein
MMNFLRILNSLAQPRKTLSLVTKKGLVPMPVVSSIVLTEEKLMTKLISLQKLFCLSKNKQTKSCHLRINLEAITHKIERILLV